MRTEGIKALSKRIRRCSADGRKRYENDVWTQIFLKTEQKSCVFVLKTDLVSRVKPASDRTDFRRLTSGVVKRQSLRDTSHDLAHTSNG